MAGQTNIKSWHAPDVASITEGNAHKTHELGSKTGIASANSGRPYDGVTLAMALDQIEKLTGTQPTEVSIDLGDRGHGITQVQTQVSRSLQKSDITPTKRRCQKRCNVMKAVISHCKNDRKVDPSN